MAKEGVLTKHGRADWKNSLNERVECLVRSNHLKFTVDIWDTGGVPNGIKFDVVTVCYKEVLPYLVMEFFWCDDALLFKVHLNPNQQVKYLNQGSAHMRDVFKAIISGVMVRLVKITTQTPDNEGVVLDQLYPEHARALKKSKLHSASALPHPGQTIGK